MSETKTKQVEISFILLMCCIAAYSRQYDPYGQVTDKSTGINEYDIFYGFNAEEFNPVTKTQYLRARYYTPNTGTFLTQDSVLGSVSNLNSQNRYSFAESDPVNNIDPSGHAVSLTNNAYARNMAANGSIDEILNMEIAGTLQQWQIKANNAFYDKLYQAQAVSYQDIQAINSISGISQATANYYINNGGIAALKAAISLGCVPGEIVNGTIKIFETNVNATKNSVNSQIASVKANKTAQNAAREAEKARLEDITKKLHNLMFLSEYKYAFYTDYTGNLVRIHSHLSLNARSIDFFFKSRTGGAFDLKTKPEWESSDPFLYEGKTIAPDAPGNILYGYMGKAYGFSDDTLYNMAGLYQIVSGTTTSEWVYKGNGDDPFDQYYISLGVDYYNKTH